MVKDIWFRNHFIRDAIGKALYDKMKEDPSIYLMGEGSHMKMRFDSPDIAREFPERILTLPISEDANTNFAVGASLIGVKPIVDVITADFLYRTMDSICNTAAKTDYLYPGRTIVIRAEFMTGGPTTGQRLESLFCHIPQLRVVIPSYPDYAYELMKQALDYKGITIFFEDREIKDSEFASFDSRALIKSFNGDKLTVITYGLTTRQLHRLIYEHNLQNSVDLIPLQTICPIDWEMIYAHAKHTGKVLIVEPDMAYMGVGAEISARIGENCEVGFQEMEDPIKIKVKRLGMKRTVIPASLGLHDQLQPSDTDIVKTIEEMIA